MNRKGEPLEEETQRENGDREHWRRKQESKLISVSI